MSPPSPHTHTHTPIILSHYTLQSSKVSKSPLHRLTRRDRSRRGQESASKACNKDKAHIPFSEVTCNSHSASGRAKLSGPSLSLRRQTLLLEDELDSAPFNYRESVCSLPDLTSQAAVSRSMFLHQPPPYSTLILSMLLLL